MYATPLSLITPVGLSLEASLAAMRAGIDGFAELPYSDNAGEPIIGAVVPIIDLQFRPKRRIEQLLSVVLMQVIGKNFSTDNADKIVLLCLPEAQRPGHNSNATDLGWLIEDAMQARIDRQYSKVFASGNIAAYQALRYAEQIIDETRRDCVLVAADSLIGAETLLWLDVNNRLLREGNSDGVIPGEAAAVLSLSAEPNGLSLIMGTGIGTESATPFNDEPLLGTGMADAIRESLAQAGLALHEIDVRLSDVAGESWAFEELSLAQSRVMREVRDEQPLWHPADKIGETGAVAGAICLTVAQSLMSSGQNSYSKALCQGSAPTGHRAASVLVSAMEAG